MTHSLPKARKELAPSVGFTEVNRIPTFLSGNMTPLHVLFDNFSAIGEEF